MYKIAKEIYMKCIVRVPYQTIIKWYILLLKSRCKRWSRSLRSVTHAPVSAGRETTATTTTVAVAARYIENESFAYAAVAAVAVLGESRWARRRAFEPNESTWAVSCSRSTRGKCNRAPGTEHRQPACIETNESADCVREQRNESAHGIDRGSWYPRGSVEIFGGFALLQQSP